MRSEIVTFNSPKSQVSEIFRTLRTNVQFMNSNRNLKTLLITSTMPGEGKSWVTANLAVAFAQAGKKVALIDTDMRKGRQDFLFDVPSEYGLSNYLSGLKVDGQPGDSDFHKYIYRTEMENLYVVPAGSVPPNPSELLSTDKMKNAIETLKYEVDIIILDGTPSSIVTDSVILSKDVDATLIVAAYKKTKKEDLKRLKKEIENVGGRVTGVTINKIKKIQKRYQNGYYYYYSDNTPTVKG